MARRSRAEMAAEKLKNQQRGKQSQLFSVGIYARLSIENSRQSDEKDVIENQIDFCKNFVSERTDMNLTSVYSDDGVTGRVFKRDAFDKMIQDIEIGKIDCVVVRDFSRFGRSYLDCLHYLNKRFPELGIRFIAITDNFDSLTCDESSLEVFLKNLMNQWYSDDISRKSSTALRTQMLNGTFRKRNLPYGYMWGENPLDIVIDEEVAHFVKMMFQWKMEGKSSRYMASQLDELQAPLPDLRKYQNGVYSGEIPLQQNKYWGTTTIDSILSNPHYIGDLVLGRTEVALYKGIPAHKVKDENLWIIYENNHPALVCREVFSEIKKKSSDIASERQEKMKETEKARSQLVDLFDQKMFCGDCGKRMWFRKNKNVTKTAGITWVVLYVCSAYSRKLQPPCTPHRLKQDIVEEKVLKAIKSQVKIALDYEKLLELLKNSHGEKSIRDRQNAQISSLRLKINGIRQRNSRLYTDFADGILTQEEYLFAQDSYREDLNKLETALTRCLEEKQQFQDAMSTNNKWITLMKSLSKTKKLNQNLVDIAIEKILIYEDERIEVIMKYQDIFLNMTAWIEEVQNEVSA